MNLFLFFTISLILICFIDVFLYCLVMENDEPVIIVLLKYSWHLLYSFVEYWRRGFDNTKKVTFNVNEQITLGGDISYYITKEEYIGKSRKPKSITYYDSKYCGKYYETSKLECAYYYQDYQTAMNMCQMLKSMYDMKQLEKMEKEELKKLSTVHTTNKYTI